jgi:quinol monooxygenase YgiN
VLHQAQDNPGRFFFYEKYKNKQAYDYHMSTAYLQEVFSNFAELVSVEPQVEMYEDIASIAY